VSDERRQFQRLALSEPLDGWFGDYPVRLVDVSAVGALVEFEEPIPPAARALLRFYWRGRELEILTEVVRTDDRRSGLQFVEESAELWSLIANSATEILLAMEANARGDREANVVGDQTFTSALRPHATGLVSWILGPDGWKSHRVLLADQPEDGFTVSESEPEEQVELLRRTYEDGDTEARRMTRMLAELSVHGG
jgi:hypothetical protein